MRTHPYMFFEKKDIEHLREKINKEPFLTRWKIFLNNADRIVELPVADRARAILTHAGIPAFAYAITGEAKYAERAKKEALSAAGMDNNIWAPELHYNKGASLDTSEMVLACAYVYDWCHDVLDENEKKILVDAIINKGIKPYLYSCSGSSKGVYNIKGKDYKDWWVENPVTNWCGVVHGGVGLGALALYDESEEARQAVKEAAKYIPPFLDHVVLKDGGGHEGVMYNIYGFEYSIPFLVQYKRMFGTDMGVFEKFTSRLLGYWHIYMQGPDKAFANFNNMNEYTCKGLWGEDMNNYEGGPSSIITTFVESLIPGGDPLLLWAADNGAVRFTWRGSSPFYLLWRREDAPSLVGQPRPKLQDTVLFRGAGHGIFNSEKLWLAYNGGWISDKSHHNKDLGTFVLVADGERVINDPGYGDAETWQHSTVLVNEEGQFVGAQAHYLHFGAGEGYRYLASDLSGAYTFEALTRCIRHVMMIRDRYIVILDDLAAASPTSFESRLQSRLPVIVQNGHAVIKGEKNDIHILAPAPDEAELTYRKWYAKSRQQLTRWEWDSNWHSRRERNVREINVIDEGKAVTYIGVRPADPVENTEIITILCPVQPGEAAPQAEFTADGILRVKDGKGEEDVIVFTKGEGRWSLASVNGEDASNIPSGEERSLKPLSGIHK